jgi:hypothetical protein
MATGAANSFLPAGSSHFSKTGSQPRSGHGITVGRGPEVFEPFEAYRYGTKAWKGVLQMHKLNNRELGGLERELLDKSSKYHETVPKASQKIGIPKTTADINADSLMRSTFVRNAVNAAGINLANESCRSIIGFSCKRLAL